MYATQAARDALKSYGKDYADYIERHTLGVAEWYASRGLQSSRERVMTESLGARLSGNNGN